MIYEEAKDRLDKHAQYCLNRQDLYAYEIVLEQSINKSIIEDIKAEIQTEIDDNITIPEAIDFNAGLIFALEIINKYTAEKEK